MALRSSYPSRKPTTSRRVTPINEPAPRMRDDADTSGSTVQPNPNVRSKVVRSILTIALYAFAGPLFGAGFFLGLSQLPSASGFAASLGIAFTAAPMVGLFAYPIGLIPALFTGCLSALLSPVTPGSLKYIAHSVVVGTLSTALLLGVLRVFGTIFFGVVASGAFAAMCCAIISSFFRFRPDDLVPETARMNG
jgi:hypothetical protein